MVLGKDNLMPKTIRFKRQFDYCVMYHPIHNLQLLKNETLSHCKSCWHIFESCCVSFSKNELFSTNLNLRAINCRKIYDLFLILFVRQPPHRMSRFSNLHCTAPPRIIRVTRMMYQSSRPAWGTLLIYHRSAREVV